VECVKLVLFLGVAQVASEGMDDTRMDLTQLEESGTGRSVPTTPLQVSPQGTLCKASYHFDLSDVFFLKITTQLMIVIILS
jgi:hypothetical protein